MPKTYLVEIEESIVYSKEFDEDEILEIAERVGINPDGSLTVEEALGDLEVREALEEALQRYGDVQSSIFSAREVAAQR